MTAQTCAPLPEGLAIAGYRIVKKIAAGGFSIVYLATDPEGGLVAIKEYLPASLAQRKAGQLVPGIAAEDLSAYRVGLRCFFEEGRALAAIVHPQVVSVTNFFRANETVYMVMEYAAGYSLQEAILGQHRRQPPNRLSPRFIRNVFCQVMDGLREVHTHKLLHLDLKPANIYLRENGSAVLLDFGAARAGVQNLPERFHPMYTPGFAAPELYHKAGKLGPWSDIYGVGACMYACMAGAPPQPGDQRVTNDQMPQRLDTLKGRYPVALIELVRWSLELDPMLRPHSVFALQKVLRDVVPPAGSRFERLRSWLSRLRQRALRPIVP